MSTRATPKQAQEPAAGGPQGHAPALPPMGPRDVALLSGAADPRLSPDGRLVAFVRWNVDEVANRSRTTIWVVPADGSAPARPFTGGDRDHSPRWSPDGR